MALLDGKLTMDASLYVAPTDYTGAGGTDLGLLQSAHLVGFNHDFELITKQNFGTHFHEARLLGTNVIYQITVANRSTKLHEIFFHSRADADDYGVNQPYLYGNLVGTSELFKLLIAPAAGATLPHLYIPRGFVTAVEPVIWDRRVSHVDLAMLTVVALWDTTLSTNALYGDPALWSVLQP